MAKKPFVTNFCISADKETLDQFNHCLSNDFVVAGSLMPDAHSGYVAPIGAVLVTKDFVVPSWVGFDIGCGMIALKLSSKGLVDKIMSKRKEVYDSVKKLVPMGMGEYNKPENISEESRKELKKLIEKFEKGAFDKTILNVVKTSALKHLGTLGGGNHFIEIAIDRNEVWLVIHSGSRAIGHTIAQHYMKKASKSDSNYEVTSPLSVNDKYGKEYLNALNFCLDYALLNRLEMSRKVKTAIESVLKEKINIKLWTNKNHNHAITEKIFSNNLIVHRKGATPSRKGELGVIPANMRDGSFLVEGKGNKDFLYSSSHGAGRKMSRKQAKQNITIEEFKSSMQGIQGTVEKDFIDEAPQAYKDINQVMDSQKKSVKIIKQIRPIINWKGK